MSPLPADFRIALVSRNVADGGWHTHAQASSLTYWNVDTGMACSSLAAARVALCCYCASLCSPDKNRPPPPLPRDNFGT